MKKYLLLLLLPLCLFSKERPNILYIFTDDQSYRTVSCYPGSYEWVKTPNIDRLAEEGVRFENVYMAPFCVPSRMTYMTGNMPHAIRGRFGGETLKGEELQAEIKKNPFWLQRLRESGYHTGMIGKWHIYSRMPAVGTDWDYAAYWHKKMINAYYYGQKISINGSEPASLNGYSTDRYTDLAIDYINERAKKEKPWHLWLCYSGVHMPQHPAKRHEGKLSGSSKIPIPVQYDTERPGKPQYIKDLTPMSRDPQYKKLNAKVQNYHSCVMSIDESVGRLMKTLKENGQLENTIVIFGSDQGLAIGQYGFSHKKNAPYDETLRSPFIVRYPAEFPKGKVCKERISGPDVVQTMHELTGVKPLPAMDGMSLVPLLKNPDRKLPREAMLFSNVRTHFAENIPKGVKVCQRKIDTGVKGDEAMPMYMMVIKGRYKYVRYTAKNYTEEIYDMESDPKEIRNLAQSIEYQKLLKELRTYTEKEFRKTQSGFDSGHFVDLFPAPGTPVK